MSKPSIVGLSGNITSPSKTRNLVAQALRLVEGSVDAETTLFEIADFGAELGQARRLTDLSATAQERVARLVSADALIVGVERNAICAYPWLGKWLWNASLLLLECYQVIPVQRRIA